MSRFYLAGRYIRREELARCADDLRARGHVVDARWLLGEHQWDGAAVETARAYENGENPPDAYRFALDDVEDLRAADVVVSFTETPRDTFSEADVRAAFAYPVGDAGMHSWEVYSFPGATAALNRTAGKSSRGGRHVEYGMAVALDKRLVVIGPPENVFHLLPGVEIHETWAAFLAEVPDAD